MRWHLSHGFDQHGRQLADRHYSRKKIGAPQFVPPGERIVLVIPNVVWVTSRQRYVKHDWPGAWMNTIFRNEAGPDTDFRSSELVIEAVAATRWIWPTIPAHGLITLIDERKIRHKRDPGRCFRKAGFQTIPCRRCAVTRRLLVLSGGGVMAPRMCRTCRGTGETRTLDRGLLVLQLVADRFPDAQQPLGATASLDFREALA